MNRKFWLRQFQTAEAWYVLKLSRRYTTHLLQAGSCCGSTDVAVSAFADGTRKWVETLKPTFVRFAIGWTWCETSRDVLTKENSRVNENGKLRMRRTDHKNREMCACVCVSERVGERDTRLVHMGEKKGLKVCVCLCVCMWKANKGRIVRAWAGIVRGTDGIYKEPEIKILEEKRLEPGANGRQKTCTIVS